MSAADRRAKDEKKVIYGRIVPNYGRQRAAPGSPQIFNGSLLDYVNF